MLPGCHARYARCCCRLPLMAMLPLTLCYDMHESYAAATPLRWRLLLRHFIDCCFFALLSVFAAARYAMLDATPPLRVAAIALAPPLRLSPFQPLSCRYYAVSARRRYAIELMLLLIAMPLCCYAMLLILFSPVAVARCCCHAATLILLPLL